MMLMKFLEMFILITKIKNILHERLMVDLLNNEIKIGDKVAFIPSKNNTPYVIQYGIVETLTKDNNGAWCKSISSNNPVILRYFNQLIKLN